MKRFIGLAASIAVLAIAVAACAPPKTDPGPPPPPPKHPLPVGIWRTDGTLPGATECVWSRYDANGDRITYESSDHGARYVETAATDSDFITHGCQAWHQWTDTQQVGSPARFVWTGQTGQIYHPRQSYADGDYIVGHNWPTETGDVGPSFGILGKNPTNPGTNPSECQWYRLRDFRDEASPSHVSQIASGNGYGDAVSPQGPGWFTWHEGEGIRLVDCNGMWTPG